MYGDGILLKDRRGYTLNPDFKGTDATSTPTIFGSNPEPFSTVSEVLVPSPRKVYSSKRESVREKKDHLFDDIRDEEPFVERPQKLVVTALEAIESGDGNNSDCTTEDDGEDTAIYEKVKEYVYWVKFQCFCH